MDEGGAGAAEVREGAECCAQTLPPEIWAKIQIHLPVSKFFQSRSVCKAWNSAMDCPTFREERRRARNETCESWLFVAGLTVNPWTMQTVACAYNPESEKWHKIELPSKLRPLSDFSWLWRWLEDCSVPKLPQWAEWSEAAGGGPLCSVVVPDPRGIEYPVATLTVGNPLRSSWLDLPPIPENLRVWDVKGLHIDERNQSLKLVVVGGGEDNNSTHVYDSRKGFWRVVDSVPPRDAILRRGDCMGVAFDGCFYYLKSDCNLLAFDLEREVWKQVNMVVQKPRFSCIHDSDLVVIHNRLICVGVIHKAQRKVLRVWELDVKQRSWTLLAVMPQKMFEKFLGKTGYLSWRPSHGGFEGRMGLKFASIGHVIYFLHRDVEGGISCDLKNNPPLWRWLPSRPFGDFCVLSVSSVNPWLVLSG